MACNMMASEKLEHNPGGIAYPSGSPNSSGGAARKALSCSRDGSPRFHVIAVGLWIYLQLTIYLVVLTRVVSEWEVSFLGSSTLDARCSLLLMTLLSWAGVPAPGRPTPLAPSASREAITVGSLHSFSHFRVRFPPHLHRTYFY